MMTFFTFKIIIARELRVYKCNLKIENGAALPDAFYTFACRTQGGTDCRP